MIFNKVTHSKTLIFSLILAFILLITTEASPGKVSSGEDEKNSPVVRVKEVGRKISAAQKERFERLMDEGKNLLLNEMNYDSAIKKFNEAKSLAVSKTQKSDVYFYLSLAFYASIEKRGKEGFIDAVKKLLEVDYYRDLDRRLCSPKYIEMYQEIKKDYGILKILSKPAGADVYLNNSKISAGATPLTIASKAGSIKVKVKKGNKKKEDTLMVIAGKETISPIYVLTGRSSLIYYVLGGAALAVGVAIAVWPKGPEPQPKGSIRINSNPDGAAVFLNGNDTGQVTDCTLTDISPGSHTVKLVKEGYVDHQETASVTAGETTTIDTELTKHTITVTNPTSGVVWYKGEEKEIRWTTNPTNIGRNTGLSSGLTQGSHQVFSSLGRSFSSSPVIRGSKRSRSKLEGISSSRYNEKFSNKSYRTQDIPEKFSSLAKNGGNVHVPRVFRPLGNLKVLTLTNVKIELYKGADKEKTIAESTSNTGSYAWTVDISLEDGSDYKVVVSCVDDPSVNNESPNFKIQEPIPDPPENLQATAVSSSQINLTWEDNSDNEDGFKIERREGAFGSWISTTVGAGVTNFQDTDLEEETTYYYRVLAYNASGESDYSNEVSAGTPLGPPPAPWNLLAAAVSSTQINLAWEDNSDNEDGFRIERKQGASGSWSQIASIGENATTYQDSGLAANTTYYYRVLAYNTAGTSEYSNEASVTTSETPPDPPENLQATAVSSSQINLSWTDNSNNEDGFKIERKEGAFGSWGQTIVGANVTTYQDTGLEDETTYYYRILAYNAAGDSAYSDEVEATTPLGLPEPPTNLQATAASSSQINLSWVDNSDNESGFKIERKNGTSGSWSQIGMAGANATTYQDTGLAANTYYYRILAYNTAGDSEYSNEASASISETPPPDPTNLQATAVSSSQINLSWTDNSNNESGFKIERKNGTSGSWSQIGLAGANITTYQDTGLAANTTYSYRVKAYNIAGDSSYSNEASATTQESVVGIEWVEIPAGSFSMGDNFNEGADDEKPVHNVNLSTYYISKYEVTFDQYDQFCNETSRSKPSDEGWGRGTRPVINVSWYDAKAFCDWLSSKTGENIHLPTEAQWEKAARGTDQRRYPWGNDPDTSKANYANNVGQTMPVGSYPAGVSPYGIHDMAGNVWEWCSDRHRPDYYSNSPTDNPQGPSTGSLRVYRGGAWGAKVELIRSANRGQAGPDKFNDAVGFRICKE